MKKFKLLVSRCSGEILTHLVCILLTLRLTEAGPLTHQPPDLDIGNNSLSSLPLHSGCRYQGSFYTLGEEVPTNEPCLVCECKAAVVCKLRICQDIPVPPPPGCIVVHKARKCCARLVCNNHVHETNRKLSREQKLPVANTTLSTAPIAGAGYCVLDGTVYAEGSAMRSSSLCQYCFCIRGQMKCSSPQCVIPVNGCKPKFRSYACCPTNYDCQESNSSAITQTVPSSTPLPTFLKGCIVQGRRIEEGEPVLPLQLPNQTNPCQNCFCMGGVIHCRPLECDRPIEGCRPITEPGHCCPDRYDCTSSENVTAATTATSSTPTAIVAEDILQRLGQRKTENLEYETTTLFTTGSEAEESATETSSSSASLQASDSSAEVTQLPVREGNTVLESIEKLPIPAEHKMATASSSGGTDASSSEENRNVVIRNRSDSGSREERRNKDRHDYHPRNSFEDDEKEDSVSFSYEHQELGSQDSGSSVSYEDTTDQSSSDSEMEQDTEISRTEENDVERGVSSNAEQLSLSSSSGGALDEPSAEFPGSTFLPVEGNNEGKKKKSPSGPFEKDESSGELAATIANMPGSSSAPAVAPPSSTSITAENGGIASSSSSIGAGVEVEGFPTTMSPVTGGEGELEALNFSSAAISGLNEDSAIDTEPAATTAVVINQDVESAEVSPAVSPTPTPLPSTILKSASEGVQLVETTVKNVQFIPFGVEDAVMSPLNDSLYEQVPSVQLAYDNHALKISLIPPTPPKGYNSVRQSVGGGGGAAVRAGDNGHMTPLPSPIRSPNATQDDLRNAIMDVPVSTSLYSHGYYHRNGIIIDDGAKDSLELEISSRRPFPGQVFDDDEALKRGPPVPHKRIGGAGGPPLPTQPITIPPAPVSLFPPVNPTLSDGNPARTYSRFGIQDSAVYRYGLGNPNQNSPPPAAMTPPASIHPHRHPPLPHNEHQQQQYYNPQSNHHRYYDAPEQDSYHPDYRMVISEDDVVYDDEIDDEGDIAYDEQSSEVLAPRPHDRHHNTPTSTVIPPTPSESLLVDRVTSKVPPLNLTQLTTNATTTTRTTMVTGIPSSSVVNEVKKVGGFTNSSSGGVAYKPAVAYPFTIPKKPSGLDFNLGLKLSGCNIYGKMYNVGDIIRELSSACIRCLCTEVGVQCTALPC